MLEQIPYKRFGNFSIEMVKFFPRKKQCIMVLHYRDHQGNWGHIRREERFESIEAGVKYLIGKYADEVKKGITASLQFELQARTREEAKWKEYHAASQAERRAKEKLKNPDLTPAEKADLEKQVQDAFIRQMQINPD